MSLKFDDHFTITGTEDLHFLFFNSALRQFFTVKILVIAFPVLLRCSML